MRCRQGSEQTPDETDNASGLRQIPDPPDEADALGVALHYVVAYDREYSRARKVAKHRARDVVVWTSVANGLIAVVGVVVGVTGWTWIGIISTALAGAIGVLATWDRHFRHTELWVQRTLIVNQISMIRRDARFRAALGESRETLARDIMTALDAVLGEDLASWSEIRRRRSDQPKTEQVGDGDEPES